MTADPGVSPTPCAGPVLGGHGMHAPSVSTTLEGCMTAAPGVSPTRGAGHFAVDLCVPAPPPPVCEEWEDDLGVILDPDGHWDL